MLELLRVAPVLRISVLQPKNRSSDVRRDVLDVLGVHGFLSVCWHENLDGFVVIADGTGIERAANAAEDFGAPGARILDPACGWGRILVAAKAAGFTVIGSDVVNRLDQSGLAAPFQVCDFLKASPVKSAWSVISNPPFDHVQKFCEHALEIAT
jgi:hypothetical protein